MTTDEIIEMFETIIDDSPDETYTLNLLNLAKDETESMRPWNFLRAFDNSQTTSPSDNYLSVKTLPADFAVPRKLYLASEITPYILIGFEERERYKDIYKRWYIDWANSQFSLCGKVGANFVINLYYSKFTADLSAGETPIWPVRFHKYIPYKMAEMHMAGADADDINFRMSAQDLRIANNILKQMTNWDASIKTVEYNDKMNGSIDYGSYPNVVGGIDNGSN